MGDPKEYEETFGRHGTIECAKRQFIQTGFNPRRPLIADRMATIVRKTSTAAAAVRVPTIHHDSGEMPIPLAA